jgi:hypothetical protein
VMEATDDQESCFYVHTLAVGPEGRLSLLQPECIGVGGKPVGD